MGSGGGGSGAGTVDYPLYIKETHEDWLDGAGVAVATPIDRCITEVMNTALGNSPFPGMLIEPPTADIDAYLAAIQEFKSMLNGHNVNDVLANHYDRAMRAISDPVKLEIDDITVDDIDIATIPDTVVDDREIDNIADVDDLVVADTADITDAEIVDDVTAFSNQLDDELLKVLPRFRRGMQDINAVVSSSFAIGEAIVTGFGVRDVDRHSSTLRVSATMKNADTDVANMNKDVQVGVTNLGKDVDISKSNLTKNIETARFNIAKDVAIEPINTGRYLDIGKTNLAKNVETSKANLSKDIQVGITNLNTRTEYERFYLAGTEIQWKAVAQIGIWYESYARMEVEGRRIKIVATGEYNDRENAQTESNAMWDLEVFQYGANVLASVSGGVAGTKPKKPDVAMRVLGGAMSGAAAGTMVSPGYGTIIGAVLGAAMGLMSSM